MEHCSKEKELDTIKKLLYGNGKKGLITLTSDLNNKFDNLDKSISHIQSNVDVLVRFQTQIETKEKEGAVHEKKIEKLRQDEMVNKRWRIGLTISTILGMLAIIVSLLAINFNEKQDNAVSEDEFKELWEKYKKDHRTRDATDTTLSYLAVGGNE
jgi:hypothetical protein